MMLLTHRRSWCVRSSGCAERRRARGTTQRSTARRRARWRSAAGGRGSRSRCGRCARSSGQGMYARQLRRTAGVGAWGSAAVASGVAVAVSAMVGGRVDKVEVLEEKQAVLRMKRERGHAEGRHWISKYAQVCGF
eukprot:3933678-Rhodomonas_salina.1